jgi:hypothetical protein
MSHVKLTAWDAEQGSNSQPWNHKEASSSSVAILAHGYAERVMRRRIPRVAKPQREDILTDCKQSVLGGAELLERPFLRWAAFLPNLLLRAMNEGGREGNAFQSQVEDLYHTILSTTCMRAVTALWKEI